MKLAKKISLTSLAALGLITTLTISCFVLTQKLHAVYVTSLGSTLDYIESIVTLQSYSSRYDDMMKSGDYSTSLPSSSVDYLSSYEIKLIHFIKIKSAIAVDSQVDSTQIAVKAAKRLLEKMQDVLNKNQHNQQSLDQLEMYDQRLRAALDPLYVQLVEHTIARKKTIDEYHYHIKLLIIMLIIIAVVVIAAANIYLKRSLILPITLIQKMTNDIRGGHLSMRIPFLAKDELGLLAQSLNQMADELSDTTISKNYFNGILHAMADSMIVVDSSGNVQSFNQATLRLLEIDESKLMGKHITDILLDCQWHGESSLQCLLSEGIIAHNVERAYITASGITIPVRFSGSVMVDREDKFIGIVCMAHDIRHQKATENALANEREQLGVIFNTIHEAIVIIDCSSTIISSNERANYLLCAANDALIGRKMDDVLLFSDAMGQQKPIANFVPQQNDDRVYYPELIFKTAQNTVTLEVSIYSLKRHENNEAKMIVLRDITIHKEARAQLLKSKESAELANRMKSDFVAVMSHEIRTPLIGVLGMTELLLDSRLDNDQKKLASSAYSSGKHLLTLINDILDFSKIEANKLELENKWFSLFKFCEDMLAVYQRQADSKGLHFDYQFNAPKAIAIQSDECRLRQVLTNLLGNALKFTQQGSIAFILDLDSKGHLKIIVSDSGIGIKKEMIGKLFESFTQVDTSITRKYGGTGLGLAISKRIVEIMGGIISVDSTLGQGSSFTVELDVAIDQRDASYHADKNKHQAESCDIPKGARILLAEDNAINQEVARRMLDIIDCEIVITANGQECLDTFKTDTFDCILMDCQMPKMDGFEATQLIRQLETKEDRKPTPIIAVSAGTSKDEKKHCFDAGMTDFLAKPYTKQQLYQSLAKYIVHTDAKTPIDSNQFSDCIALMTACGLTPDTLQAALSSELAAIKVASSKADHAQLVACSHQLLLSAHHCGAQTLITLLHTIIDTTDSAHHSTHLIQLEQEVNNIIEYAAR